MDARKRKLPQSLLGRRVRARAEPEPDLDDIENETDGSAPSEDGVAEDNSGSEAASDGDAPSRESDREEEEEEGSSDGEDDDDDEEEEEEEQEDLPVDAGKISFGALAKAQAMLPQSSRRKKKGVAAAEDDDDSNNLNEEAPGFRSQFMSSKKEKAPARSSKHAPMEMSSKRPVSRKREIITVKKFQARDPRFDPLVAARSSAGVGSTHGNGEQASEDRARRAYAFLDEYRDDEMRQLKAAIKKAKNPADKEKLQRALMSMESRKRAREQKDRERAVVEEHRRREKELVKEGKKAKPFYLKKSEQRKRLLVDQFTSMSEKQREKAIEKKRKKVAAKEKKELPLERRMRD